MYSGYNGPAARTQRFFTYSNIPITLGLIVAACIHFVLNFFTGHAIEGWFACPLPSLVSSFDLSTIHQAASSSINTRFWTLLTYPVAQIDFIPTLFSCLWLYWIGGSLERAWGRQKFAAFTLVITLATSTTLWLGCRILHTEFGLAGLSLPLIGMTVAWASINPYEELIFWFVIRMKAWMLAALLVCVMLFIDFGGSPLLGLFGLVNPLIAYLWGQGRFDSAIRMSGGGKRPVGRGPDLRFVDVDKPKRRGQPLDDLRGKSARGPIGIYQDWRQRKKLEKLWRDSGFTDKDDSERKR